MYGPLLLISGSHTKLTLSIAEMPKPMQNKNIKMTGATRVTAPVAKGIVQKLNKPKFSMTKPDGAIHVSHREYVDDILGSVLYSGGLLRVNPGLQAAFPWLSTIASSYETYRFTKLKFIFESTSATTHTGAVMMAMDYDPNDASPLSKTQLMAYAGATRSPPWESFEYACSKADLLKLPQKFVRAGIPSETNDLRLFDVGNIHIFTMGQQNANLVGELYVEYEIDLFTPQLDLLTNAEATSSIIRAGGTISLANWMGISPTFTGGLNISFSSSPYGLKVNQVGSFIFIFSSAGTGLVPVASIGATSPGNLIAYGPSASSGVWTIQQMIVMVNDPNIPIAIPALHSAGTVTAFNLRVARYAASLG